MLAKNKEKELAIKMRLAGESYNRIKSAVGVSKGTLSLWLRDMPLSKTRIRELRDWNVRRIERFRETMRQKKKAILDEVYKKQKESILPLSQRDLFVAGLFLYWGEGGKTKSTEISLSNTDPETIISFIQWLKEIFHIEKSKLRIRLHLYQDMSIQEELEFWSKILNIPLNQFKKPYIKSTNRSAITYKNGFGHGTCNVIIGDVRIANQVLMGLKVLRDYFKGL